MDDRSSMVSRTDEPGTTADASHEGSAVVTTVPDEPARTGSATAEDDAVVAVVHEDARVLRRAHDRSRTARPRSR